jgi:hypothetical protein
MNIEITFYTKKDPDYGVYLAYSSIGIQRGIGNTAEEAIQDHLNKFMAQCASSKYETIVAKQPQIEIKKFTFQAK